MDPNNPINKQIILSPKPLHRILKQIRIMLRSVLRRFKHKQQRIFHMATKILFQHARQTLLETRVVGCGNSSDLPVRPRGQDVAHEQRVGADAFAFGCAIQFCNVAVDLVGQHGRHFGVAGCGEDFREEAFRFHGQVAPDVGFEAAAIGRLVDGFDGVDVGVCTREEDVVQDALFGAEAGDGFVQVVDVCVERSAGDCEEAFAEVA